jgi:flagellar motor component MotA
MLRFLFFIFGCFSLIFAINMSSNILLFIDISSLAFVILIPLFFTLAHHHHLELIIAIVVSIRGIKVNQQSSNKYQEVLSTLRLTISGSGVIGLLVGFVSMLSNMDDPSSIGPAMAVGLLTPLYAIIASELLVAPMINRLRQSATSPPPKPVLKPSVVTLISIPTVMIMFIMLICIFV